MIYQIVIRIKSCSPNSYIVDALNYYLKKKKGIFILHYLHVFHSG